jgi:DNA-binding NarL/FixJ family response regulator
MIRILIVDDHTIVRQGVRSLLEREPDLSVVGEAGDGRTAIRIACERNVDVVIMNVVMPGLNGIDATRILRRECPAARVLILTAHDDEEFVREALIAGALGYVLKQADASDLVSAIRAVHRGEPVLSPPITRLVIEDYLRWADVRTPSEARAGSGGPKGLPSAPPARSTAPTPG